MIRRRYRRRSRKPMLRRRRRFPYRRRSYNYTFATDRRRSRTVRAAIPMTKTVRMRYCERVNIDAGAGTIAEYTYRANDVYDPNETGTGHQPMGLDQWFQFYNKATVIGSKIKLTWITPSATITAGTFMVGIQQSNSNTLSLDQQGLLESSQVHSRILGSSDTGKGIQSVVHTYSPKKWFNVRNPLDESDLACTDSSSPTRQCYWNCYVQALDESTDVPSMNGIVQISYTVVFSEPKELAQS